jgi:hypothetical protein
LSLVLIFRLLQLRLSSVYRVLCLLLFSEVLYSIVFYVEAYLRDPRLDYRVTWVTLQAVEWILFFWTVYALLRALLARLPGILKFSRWLLTGVTVLCASVAMASGYGEFSSGGLIHGKKAVVKAMAMAIAIDRVVATVILLVILSILIFILWFPIRMPRNLAIFTIGLVIYFSSKTASLLVQSFWEHHLSSQIGLLNVFLLSSVVAYWLYGIRARGETISVTLGHSWRSQDQQRLFVQLETLNETLSRASARKPKEEWKEHPNAPKRVRTTSHTRV